MATDEWARQIAEKIIAKSQAVAARNLHKIPYTSTDGCFDDKTTSDINWWTNGFYPGMLWQLYQATKDQQYRDMAVEIEEKLDRSLFQYNGLDHDNGFKWLLSAVANYRITKNPASWNRGMLAASHLAGRFNPIGQFIRAWNDSGDGSRAGWAIIDCMMNLPLLYWASEETNDPRFAQIARMHADTAASAFVRPDGSVNHIVEFDPATGEILRTHGGQGYAQGSTWSRGQAWAVYGFALSYLHTREASYLDTAKKAAHYFMACTPESGLVPVDFRQPADCTLEDSTASAIAACGLIEIGNCVPEPEKQVYYNFAKKLLRALDENRCCWNPDTDPILQKCTVAFHDPMRETTIIYGDYFFLEAIWKLTGKELFLW